jgi:hypothetical protein
MNILRKARKLESDIGRTLDRAAERWAKSGPREPLEILLGIVDTIEERVEPIGRGRHVFPFNKIKVLLVAGTRETRARLSAVLDSDPTLQDRIRKRLGDAGCDPSGIHVTSTYVLRAESHWPASDFHIEFDRVAATHLPAAANASTPVLKLTIVGGSAEKPSYAFTSSRINLGRHAEVRDSRNRLIRTNHVVFGEGHSAGNHTVSRRHAHIEYAEAVRQYRIVDDRSAHGTSVLRDGKAFDVPAGSRGIRLESGDEIVLGEARLRVRIGGE